MARSRDRKAAQPAQAIQVARRRRGDDRLPASGTLRRTTAAAAAATLTRPRWLLFHVVILALAVTFVCLGRWQLDVSNTKHFDFFNFQYAIQWWLFATCGLFFWFRVVRHRLNPPQARSSRDGVVVRSVDALETRTGPALLVAPRSSSDEAPTVYRGYVMTDSASKPVRSHGDSVHDAYNDYLWQLAVADGATPPVHARPSAASTEADSTDNGNAPQLTQHHLPQHRGESD